MRKRMSRWDWQSKLERKTKTNAMWQCLEPQHWRDRSWWWWQRRGLWDCFLALSMTAVAAQSRDLIKKYQRARKEKRGPWECRKRRQKDSDNSSPKRHTEGAALSSIMDHDKTEEQKREMEGRVKWEASWSENWSKQSEAEKSTHRRREEMKTKQNKTKGTERNTRETREGTHRQTVQHGGHQDVVTRAIHKRNMPTSKDDINKQHDKQRNRSMKEDSKDMRMRMNVSWLQMMYGRTQKQKLVSWLFKELWRLGKDNNFIMPAASACTLDDQSSILPVWSDSTVGVS